MLYFDDKYTRYATHFATTNQKTYLTHFVLYATGFLENTASSGAGP